jgi:hypothetical protein
MGGSNSLIQLVQPHRCATGTLPTTRRRGAPPGQTRRTAPPARARLLRRCIDCIALAPARVAQLRRAPRSDPRPRAPASRCPPCPPSTTQRTSTAAPPPPPSHVCRSSPSRRIQRPRGVAVQVEFETQIYLNQVFIFLGSRVETRRFHKLWVNLLQPPPRRCTGVAGRLARRNTVGAWPGGAAHGCCPGGGHEAAAGVCVDAAGGVVDVDACGCGCAAVAASARTSL